MLLVITAEPEFEPWQSVSAVGALAPNIALPLNCLWLLLLLFYKWENWGSEGSATCQVPGFGGRQYKKPGFLKPRSPFFLHSLIQSLLSPHGSLHTRSGKIHVYCPKRGGTCIPSITFQYSHLFGSKTVSSSLSAWFYHQTEKRICSNASSQWINGGSNL